MPSTGKNVTTGELRETIMEILSEKPEGSFIEITDVISEISVPFQMALRVLNQMERDRVLYRAHGPRSANGKRKRLYRLWNEHDEDKFQEKMAAKMQT
jgi:hypothetical protein